MGNECIFCQIINREMPGEFLYENDSLVVFKDIHPHAPVHLLIVPKKHIRSINDVCKEDEPMLADLLVIGRKMAKKMAILSSGYKLLFNVERGGGQVIFHLHLHLLGGWKR